MRTYTYSSTRYISSKKTAVDVVVVVVVVVVFAIVGMVGWCPFVMRHIIPVSCIFDIHKH